MWRIGNSGRRRAAAHRLAKLWEGAKLWRRMGLLFRLITHLLLTLARLAGPGGVRAVAAESLAVKHQRAAS